MSRAASVPSLSLLTLDQAGSAEPAARATADWVRGTLMRPHPDLGRTGHVCPFTAQASRLALLRIGVSDATPDRPAVIKQTMVRAIEAFDRLEATRKTRIFRTVIVTFPNCTGRAGIEALHGVQNALRRHSVLGGKMVGLFEPDSEAEGLINRAFRPLRAPVPILAIRMLVEQDAPFVVRNLPLFPIYLAKFPVSGTRRLLGIAGTAVRRARVGAWTSPAGDRPRLP